MTLPDGWHREYQGRHGAEFFYEPRNVTMSVLPRYDSASGRASQKAPSRYVVRIHQLLARGGSRPVTLGEREAFDDAVANFEEDHDELMIQYTGPFAPYSFVDVKIGAKQ